MSTVWLIVRALIMIVVISCLVLFAVQNQTQQAYVSFIKWQSPQMPLFVLLWAAFSLGVLVWFVASTFIFVNLKRSAIKAEKEKRGIQKELERLRNAEIDEETSDMSTENVQEAITPETDSDKDK